MARHKAVAGTTLVEGYQKWPLQPAGSPCLMAPLAFLFLFGHGEQLGGSGELPKAAGGQAVRPCSTMEEDHEWERAEGAG